MNCCKEVTTPYNVCSVPWGEGGGGGGERWVSSTIGGYHEYRGGYLEYRRDVQYRGGIVIHVGDVISTMGVFSTLGGYHLLLFQYRGGGDITIHVGIS